MLASITGITKLEEPKLEEDFACETWFHVSVECGNNFWLCGDGKTSNQLDEEVWYFSEHRCD